MLKIRTPYQVLQTISIFYIALPALLFIAGWLKTFIAIPVILLALIGIYFALSSAWNYEDVEATIPESNSNFRWRTILMYFVIVSLVVFMVICSGLGGYVIQDGDYFKHNAFLKDLIDFHWPLAYEQTGPDDAPRVLNTYVGYYLPAALVGKLFGWNAANFFSFLWGTTGVLLSILWIIRIAGGWALFCTLLFLFFSGLDFMGWQFIIQGNHFAVDYNYSTWMMYHSIRPGGVFWALGSNHTAMANAPHHIFPSWVCILMLFHDAVKRESNDRILFVSSFLPFVSAFISVGALPFVILGLFQHKLKNAITWPNVLAGPVLVLIAAFYFISNEGKFVSDWIWRWVNLKDAAPYFFLFCLTGFGGYLLVMPKKYLKRNEKIWLTCAVVSFIILPLYRMGSAMDFPLKAFNPSWIVFQACVALVVVRIFKASKSTTLDKARGVLLIGFICVASIGPFSNITYALSNGLRNTIDKNEAYPINAYTSEESLQLFSDGQSFFWKHLAKPIVYDKTTSREKLTDDFGNTFKLGLVRCGSIQGYYINVNNIFQGCCIQLTKNKKGYIEALDGMGNISTFVNKEWIQNPGTLEDNVGNKFQVDILSPDNDKGYGILVNDKIQGGGLKLLKTEDGSVHTVDKLGDSWTYEGTQWIKRETLTDKFGNTFKLDLIMCNVKQGYYILINGSHKGCCAKLSLKSSGLVEALDGYGDRWIYIDQDWKKAL